MANVARSRKRHRAASAAPSRAYDAPQLTIEDLASLFETAPFGVIAIGPDGTIEYVNPRQCENS